MRPNELSSSRGADGKGVGGELWGDAGYLLRVGDPQGWEGGCVGPGRTPSPRRVTGLNKNPALRSGLGGGSRRTREHRNTSNNLYFFKVLGYLLFFRIIF